MTRLEQIEQDVRQLTAEELADFRSWFQEFDAAVWDETISNDAQSGKLARLREEAIAEHRAQRTKEL